MPRGILKTASSRDKALPAIPSSPALVNVNTERNAFRHRNDLVSLSSLNFHPKQHSTSRVVSGHGRLYGVNDSEDNILWNLTTIPAMVEPVRATREGRNTKRQHPPRSNRMRGKRYHSSRSSRASSMERRPRTRPRGKQGTSGYGSSVSSTTPPRNSSLQFNLGYRFHPTAPRRHVEELERLRLSKRKGPINIATATSKSSQVLQRDLGTSPRQNDCVGSSPLLVSSTKSNLRRRPRVDKRGSMSETDPDHGGSIPFLSTINPSSLRHKGSTTRNSNSNYHSTDPDATPRVGKRSSRRRSNAHEQVTSPITIHSLPPILPAHAEYKCRIEWEADKEAQSGNDEAGNLWKRLEQECAMSPTPPSPGHGLLHANATADDVELTPRRGRWKVKVVETPTIPTSVPAESSPRISISSSFSEHKWTEEDLQFTESAMGIDDNPVAILREVSITELLPPLSAYTYLSSLLKKRTSSRHRRRARSRRSSTLRLTRSKTRLSTAEKSRHVVHRDVKRALCGCWEGCEDEWLDDDQMGGDVWSSHMAKLISKTRSRSILESRMGRLSSGKGLDRGMSIWDLSSMNQKEGVNGLGIVMHRSATLKSRATTTGADSVIDFYVGT